MIFMQRIFFTFRTLGVIALMLYCSTVFPFACEHIRRFDSLIVVHENGTLTVRETITVSAAQCLVKRGIMRELPTHYSYWWGTRYTVPIFIRLVLMNGRRVPYHIERVSNGTVLYIGDADVFLMPGTYTYEIEYETDRQLRFFNDHDELYWNVNGNGWRLPVHKVTARVILPSQVHPDLMQVKAYTGLQDETGADYEATRHDDGSLYFETTRPMRDFEGMTIVVGWPKGVVREPSFSHQAMLFFQDNAAVLWALVWLIIFAIICIWAVYCAWREKAARTIIPLFHPPHDLSAVECGFIDRARWDDALLSSQIVQCAVRGLLTIEHCASDQKKVSGSTKAGYVLKKRESIMPPTQLEAEFLERLFGKNDTVDLGKASANLSSVEQLTIWLKALCVQWEQRYLSKWDPAFLLVNGSLIAMIVPAFLLSIYMQGNLNWVLLGFFALAFVRLARRETTATARLVYMLVFGVITAILQFWWLLALGIVAQGIALLVVPLLDPYTADGREIADQVAGFKLFLTTTEVDRLRVISTPPTRTPELYEQYLPYAMAFGVEEQWTKQFAAIFARYEQEGRPYVPVWYVGFGPYHFFAPHYFSSSVAKSFSSSSAGTGTISSSSSWSGSSGFGGGGRSGGGGGGGGGGGW